MYSSSNTTIISCLLMATLSSLYVKTYANLKQNTLWEASHESRSGSLSNISNIIGPSICIIDANNDNWPDVIFLEGKSHQRLKGKASWWTTGNNSQILTNNSGYLTKSVKISGLEKFKNANSCHVTDLNNDNYEDVILAGGSSIHIYENLKNGQFSQRFSYQAKNGSTLTKIISSDINNDGHRDIYITNLIIHDKYKKIFENSKGFTKHSPSIAELEFYEPAKNILLLNQSNFEFRNIAKAWNAENPEGRSLNAKFIDINTDGKIDLWVKNIGNTPGKVYINQGNKFETCENHPHLASLNISGSSIGSAQHKNHFQKFKQITYSDDKISETLKYTEDAFTKSTDNIFNNHIKTETTGELLIDVNNDNISDIFEAKGSFNKDQDEKNLTLGLKNKIKIGSNFNQDITIADEIALSSRGAVKVDINRDGKLDIISPSNNGPIQIYINNFETQNWISLLLSEANISNGDLIEVETEKGIFRKIYDASGTYLSQSEKIAIVGIPLGENIQRISINHNNIILAEEIKINSFLKIVGNKFELINFHNHLDKHTNYNHRLTPLTLSVHINLSSTDKKTKSKLWDESSTEQKLATLERLKYEKREILIQNIDLIEHAINNTDDQLQLSAIDALKITEHSASIYLLTKKIEKNEKICEISKVINFFFQEEEALIHHKNLFIKPLINSWNKLNSTKEKLCLINAIASSEHDRSRLFFLHLINTENNIEILSEVLKGFRMVKSFPNKKTLLSLLEKHQSHPNLSANILITLYNIDKELAVLKLLELLKRDESKNPFSFALAKNNANKLIKHSLKKNQAILQEINLNSKSYLNHTLEYGTAQETSKILDYCISKNECRFITNRLNENRLKEIIVQKLAEINLKNSQLKYKNFLSWLFRIKIPKIMYFDEIKLTDSHTINSIIISQSLGNTTVCSKKTPLNTLVNLETNIAKKCLRDTKVILSKSTTRREDNIRFHTFKSSLSQENKILLFSKLNNLSLLESQDWKNLSNLPTSKLINFFNGEGVYSCMKSNNCRLLLKSHFGKKTFFSDLFDNYYNNQSLTI